MIPFGTEGPENHNDGPEHYCPDCWPRNYLAFFVGGLIGGAAFLFLVYGAEAKISERACALGEEQYLMGTLDQACTELLVQRNYPAFAANEGCRNIGADVDGMRLLTEGMR